LRGGAGPGGESKGPAAEPKTTAADVPANPGPARPLLPLPVESESGRLAADLIGARPADWEKKLAALRDAKGGDNTQALVLAIPRLDGDRKKEAREALAERLTRMTPDTLRAMMTADDPELRRGAVLAAAMKDDKAHVPDLIDRLLDDDDLVVRAARAGLKSLSGGKDFGPQPGATRLERDTAAKGWRQWWAAQKK
ncbi:MAG: HEAT repeat domain-containing protein, partial [Gemmataceae bacterium]|nr:HEAT repeat domain-containing protein [Gemmataceae bacterium]